MYNKIKASKARPLTPKQKQQQQKKQDEQEEMNSKWVSQNLSMAYARNQTTTTTSRAIDFLDAYAMLCWESRASRLGSSPVPLDKFQTLVSEHDIPERDCVFFAQVLLHDEGRQSSKHTGKKLLWTLSHAGSDRATMHIITQSLKEVKYSKNRAARLRVTEIAHMRRHLKEIAEKGYNYRAMVLEGKVEYESGNQTAAIKHWTNAMEAAVDFAKELKEMRRRGEPRPNEDDIAGSEHQELDSPWVELSMLHQQRQEWSKAKWAIDIGCEMDDPMSHYSAALFEKKTDASGGHIVTSAWLYHMTKAAASGHTKGQHELGIFYGRSGWKYIEDEPPDHIKPTPFDSYPAEPGRGRAQASFADQAREMLGLVPAARDDPRENVFHVAAFPSTPELRMRMALEWLSLAQSVLYAPSYLFAARLLLEKTLWAGALAPRKALEMTEDRYDYASKADKEAENPIERPQEDEPEDIPNPYYDPQLAYRYVRDVYTAVLSQTRAIDIRKKIERERVSGLIQVSRAEIDDMFNIGGDDNLSGFDNMPWELRRWHRFTHVREMYMDDENHQCFDDVLGVNLFDEVKELCEEQGWDLYADDGGLMYKHGLTTNAATSAKK